MGPTRQLGETDFVRVRAERNLGETYFGNRQTESWSGKLGGTDSLISIRLKRYERETESLHCNLGGTDRSSRFDRNVMKGNRKITIPSQ